ncbi:hypothetical protein PZH36_10890 [Ruminococcus bromii]|uniref:hypothetical protein n=1 Tax=Ruminococcus bromii TaxID=40518 RepID=UPI00292CD60F|nr:hypothetical protein [Ruminococcus bromii]MDE8727609.1 hypothetical protein [Ruminococcus bromii]
MSRREQSDRHIIWSNMNLEADDWRDSYKEYLEINGLDDDPNDENKHSSISVLSLNPKELPDENYGETTYELLSDEDFEVNKNIY